MQDDEDADAPDPDMPALLPSDTAEHMEDELLVAKYEKRKAKGMQHQLFLELRKEIEEDRAARKKANE